MKKIAWLLVVVVFGINTAFADVYFGARGLAPVSLSPFGIGTIGLGAQVGANLGDPELGFGLRGIVETDVTFSGFRVGGDLYGRLGGELSYLYLGGGGTVTIGTDLAPELHGLIGLETRLGGLGLFIEAMPGYAFNTGLFSIRVAAGLNIHF
jgi:hypothetical protein